MSLTNTTPAAAMIQFLGNLVGESPADIQPVYSVRDIFQRLEKSSQKEAILGSPKDPIKALAWHLRKLCGQQLADTQCRAYHLEKRVSSRGLEYSVHFTINQKEVTA